MYETPFVRPDTTQVSADVVKQVKPPGVEETVYPVTEMPAIGAGANHETLTSPEPKMLKLPVTRSLITRPTYP